MCHMSFTGVKVDLPLMLHYRDRKILLLKKVPLEMSLSSDAE
jgi:hypothetical protein